MNNNKTLIIAEMACSHEGNIELAKKIIDAAATAKADVIQLQIWAVDSMMSPGRKEYELLSSIEFTKEEWSDLVRYSREHYPQLAIYVCVYEHTSIGFIDSLDVDGYKINSSDLSNPLVLKQLAKYDKPINLSVGASTQLEITAAIECIQETSNANITLMYGHQSFPTMQESVHMKYMPTLKNTFNLPLGYQDHTDADDEGAFWLPAAAMGMGVSVLEKHITHDRLLKGIDHESALNPDEFIKFVKMVRMLDIAGGRSEERDLSEEEIKYREFQKKSIVAAKKLLSGHTLSAEDIIFVRAERLGISPMYVDDLLGKQIISDIDAFQLITREDIN